MLQTRFRIYIVSVFHEINNLMFLFFISKRGMCYF